MRLAQITDLHLRWHQPGTSRIAKRRCRLMPELFRRALRQVAERGAEVVVVTGDLLDVPGYILDHDDYYDYRRDLWEHEVEADYRLLKELLDGCGMPYLVLPGNHDWLAVMARVFPPVPVLDLGGYRLVSFWDRDHYAHVPRRLDRERLLLEQVLADADSPPQIHLQHYVVTPELNQGWPHTYLEGEHLRRAVAASGSVVLSLSGHYHLGTEAIVDGRCTFTTGPAFAEAPHPYRLYRVDGDAVEMETLELLDQPYEQGHRAVFLDRDGVLNVQPWWRTGPEELRPTPGVGAALARLQEAGYVLVVVSSQSAAGAGYVTTEVVDSVFDGLARHLWRDGVCWDSFWYSTGAGARAVHPSLAPDNVGKPRPDLLLAARELHGLELAGSWMVGDNLTDLQAGRAAGVQPLLVRTGSGRQTETLLAERPELGEVLIAEDITAAADEILRRS